MKNELMTPLNLLWNFFIVNKIQNILSGWLPLYLLILLLQAILILKEFKVELILIYKNPLSWTFLYNSFLFDINFFNFSVKLNILFLIFLILVYLSTSDHFIHDFFLYLADFLVSIFGLFLSISSSESSIRHVVLI